MEEGIGESVVFYKSFSQGNEIAEHQIVFRYARGCPQEVSQDCSLSENVGHGITVLNYEKTKASSRLEESFY